MLDTPAVNKRFFLLFLFLLCSLILLSSTQISYAQDHQTSTSYTTNSDSYLKSFKNTEQLSNNDNNSFYIDEFFNSSISNLTYDKSFNTSNNKPMILPFTPEVYFAKNIIKVKISISGKSYIYQPSLTLVADPQLVNYQEPILPKAIAHSDALGDSFVYFNEVQFDIPIIEAKAGSYILLNYQGCDESGICYPPQKHVITIQYDINANLQISDNKIDEQAASALVNQNNTSLANDKTQDTVSYLSQAQEVNLNKGPEDTDSLFSFFKDGHSDNSDAIFKLLSNNILIGLLICFLLGIGLDLTPCVLPMLPIFSAMIIGSKKTSVKTVDVLEERQDNSISVDNNNSIVRRFNFVFMQNLGFALGLTLTYTLLGLLFSMAGAQLHGFLQSAALNFVLAFLMIICALACADVFVLKMPSFITNRLQSGTSKINPSKFPGAFVLGASAAIIASPCTSAPLAGALLYVMKNGDILMGSLVFFTIGLGMATPLFIIGMFGSKILLKSGIVGDIIKRLMVVVLIATAYMIVRHNLGRAEVFVGALVTYIVCVYTLISIVFFIRRRALPMITATVILILSLAPTYLSISFFEQSKVKNSYDAFYNANDLITLERLTKDKYSFVVFTAQWCANCKIMEREIYSTDHFINSSVDFKKILVNITDTNDPKIQEIINKYQVIGVPFFVTLNDTGNEVQSRLGLASKKTVYEALDQLRKLSNQEND